jgi:hypothetical protein
VHPVAAVQSAGESLAEPCVRARGSVVADLSAAAMAEQGTVRDHSVAVPAFLIDHHL